MFLLLFFGHHFENCLVCHLVFQKLVLWNFLIFKTGTLGCFCFSKGIISQTWDFWGTKAAKSTSFEGKKVPKYQFFKYQVAYQAVFKMMSKKKKKKKTEKNEKNELSKWKKIKKNKKNWFYYFLEPGRRGNLQVYRYFGVQHYCPRRGVKVWWEDVQCTEPPWTYLNIFKPILEQCMCMWTVRKPF